MRLSIRGGIAASFAVALGLMAGQARAFDIAIPNYNDAFAAYPFMIALEGGLMKKHGVDVTNVLNSSGGTQEVRDMVAGSLPFAQTTLSPILNANQQGADLRIVGEMIHSNSTSVFVVMPNSPIKSINDLKGKKFAFGTPQSASQILELLLLDKVGLKQSDVTMIAAGSITAQTSVLENGGADMIELAEPLYTINKDKYRAIARVGDIMPPATGSVGITSPKVMADHPDWLRGILAAHEEAVDFMKTHRAEATAIIAKKTKLDPVIVQASLNTTFDQGDSQGVPFFSRGELNPSGIDRAIDQLKNIGAIADGADLNWRKLVDQSFLPDELKVKLQ